MLDNIQVLLWSITYLEIIYWGIKHYKERLILMPWFAGSLNLAWEINALILSNAYLGHAVWFILDVFIMILNINNVKRIRNRVIYILLTIIFAIVLKLIFVTPGIDGMLVSVFIIDWAMALDFLVNVKKISKHGKIPIAITKLLGDLFAWLAYSNVIYVNVIGGIVFILNLYYLSICLELSTKESKRKIKRR